MKRYCREPKKVGDIVYHYSESPLKKNRCELEKVVKEVGGDYMSIITDKGNRYGSYEVCVQKESLRDLVEGMADWYSGSSGSVSRKKVLIQLENLLRIAL